MWQECFSYGKLIHPIVPKVNLTLWLLHVSISMNSLLPHTDLKLVPVSQQPLYIWLWTNYIIILSYLPDWFASTFSSHLARFCNGCKFVRIKSVSIVWPPDENDSSISTSIPFSYCSTSLDGTFDSHSQVVSTVDVLIHTTWSKVEVWVH